ncbi:hypothetical protein E1263_20005 [Kribbella antibiotica]|uniref:Uncharacterized protein n=1 Tax=Kribbella antibiotica TaxID=190195 RepID=A0A4R4ZHZ8_9ACTN|nr:hypothetical protein [Kribbella antibiotica]TDD58301.1 hypothetical protein E1263_20005 [Kribbella antibiotica]
MLSRRMFYCLGVTSTVAMSVVAGTVPAGADWEDPPPTPGASGNTISVSLTGTGVGNGKGGRPGHTSVKKVPVPCNYTQGFTGKHYYEFVTGGAPLGRDTNGVPFEPHPGYEQYKDDDKGHWYGGMCDPDLFGGGTAAFNEFITKWFAEHRAVYVPEGQQPPVPPIPPAILRDAAFEAMTVPEPKLNWNPKLTAAAGTVVNVDTWVWLDGYPKDLYVRASVGAVWAQVDAELTGMEVSAPDADPVSCADAGTPYAPGATSDCMIRFRKAGAGKTPVTVKVGWATTWRSSENGDPQATPDQLDIPPATAGIQVLEIQTHNR